jgi:hypothetical protein
VTALPVRSEDRVLPSLLIAGMEAANWAATVGKDEDLFYQRLLERITRTTAEAYGMGVLYRELCASAGLVLVINARSVRVGELTFGKREGVWTFRMDEGMTHGLSTGLRRAAQLVTVYSNLLAQLGEEWTDPEGNPEFTPSLSVDADTDSWNALYEAVPEAERMLTAKALFVIAGVLYKWMRGPE